jgi:hypothetical protein
MRTTVNLDFRSAELLEDACLSTGLSRHELVRLLVLFLKHSNNFSPRLYETVTYQHGGDDTVWIVVHVSLEECTYEILQDLRRNCKFSVSFFVAFLINSFLDELIKRLNEPNGYQKILDNYPRSFMYIPRFFDDVEGYITLWDVPGEKNLHKLMKLIE